MVWGGHYRRPAVFPLAILVSLVFATEIIREVVRWRQNFHDLCYGWSEYPFVAVATQPS